MSITLATKKLHPALLQHLRSTHGFERAFINVNENASVSIEASVDDSRIMSVFDMERGPVTIERWEKMSPFGAGGWNREAALRGDYTKRAALGPGQVGITSTHGYSGLQYCSMQTTQETLALYFDLGAMDSAKKLTDPEKALLIVLTRTGTYRKQMYSTFLKVTRTDPNAVLARLEVLGFAKSSKNRQTGLVWQITPAGREVLSTIPQGEQYKLERRYLEGY